MANTTLNSGTLYCGPSTSYAVAATGVMGKSAEVLWKEGGYYCVRLSSPKVEGYISNRYVTIPSGTTVSSFTPLSGEERYISASSTAYLGQGTSYQTISAPMRGDIVNYLGKKAGNLVYIEYKRSDSAKQYRAWFSGSYINYNKAPQLTPTEYNSRVTVNVNPHNSKYAIRDINGDGVNETFCNWYAYDAMLECGAQLPSWADGSPASCEAMLSSLNNGFGKWRVIDIDKPYEEAQVRANHGYPTIAIEANHVAVVVPNGNTIPSGKQYVKISQAGAVIFDSTENKTINDGWGTGNAGYPYIKFFSWYY